MSGWLNGVGQILISKAGKPYLKFTEDKELIEQFKSRISAGGTVMLKKKEDQLQELVERGKKSQEEVDTLKEKLSFIKFDLSMGPNQD